jgi:thiol:disulfide interchange protein DsbC
MKKTLLMMAIGVLMSSGVYAESNTVPKTGNVTELKSVQDSLEKAKPAVSKKDESEKNSRLDIKKIQQFPMSGMVMVENAQGEIMFLSDNGRFAFTGSIIDTWSGKKIENFDDAESLSKLPMEKLGKAFESELAGFEIGKGKQTSYVFFDPYCDHCHKIIKTAMSELSESKEHKIKFLFLPVLGQKSESATVGLFCENPKDVAQRVLEGRFEDLKAKPECKTRLDSMQKNLATAQILGIKGVPYLIRHDGKFLAGAPNDFMEWLGVKKEANKEAKK